MSSCASVSPVVIGLCCCPMTAGLKSGCRPVPVFLYIYGASRKESAWPSLASRDCLHPPTLKSPVSPPCDSPPFSSAYPVSRPSRNRVCEGSQVAGIVTSVCGVAVLVQVCDETVDHPARGLAPSRPPSEEAFLPAAPPPLPRACRHAHGIAAGIDTEPILSGSPVWWQLL